MWNRLSIPKHRFILWLATLDRLKLKGRLYRFNIISDETCILCGHHREVNEHLFFNCHLRLCCLEKVKSWLDWRTTAVTISGLLKWIKKVKVGRFRRHIFAMALAAIVYQVWKCRNEALWNAKVYTVEKMVKMIHYTVKNRIRNIMPKKVTELDSNWVENL